MRSSGQFLAAALCVSMAPTVAGQIAIDHRWTNTDAQSLIGLPMGSHKTIVDKQGNLKWSQWSLKRRPLDSPIGFSSQMDGELAIEASANGASLKVNSQELYKERYPFIVSKAGDGDFKLEELAFAVDPEAKAGEIPNRYAGAKGMDVVRLGLRNDGAVPAAVVVKLSGRARNLPGMQPATRLRHEAERMWRSSAIRQVRPSTRRTMG